MTTTPLSAEIERRLHEEAELHIAVSEDEGKIILTGIVGRQRERETALEIVNELAPGVEVEDNLEVDEALPEGVVGTLGDLVAPPVGRVESLEQLSEREDEESIEPGDFTDQEVIEFGDAAAGPSSALDDDEAGAGDEVFVPPVDPVGTDREVIGGLQTSALDEVQVERSALDGAPGDEAIRDAVLLELREDAATTDLDIEVEVEGGRVVLLGRVPYVEDVENAEEVASRVPGVVEVEERLEVENL